MRRTRNGRAASRRTQRGSLTPSWSIERPGRLRGPARDRWAVLVLPALVFLVVFFLAPLLTMSIRSITDPPDAGSVELHRVLRPGGEPPRPEEHLLDRVPLDGDMPAGRLPVRVPDDDRAGAGCRPPADRRAAAVLVQPARPDLRLAGDPPRHRGHQHASCSTSGSSPSHYPDPDHGRRDHRDVAHPAAVHGPADLRGHAPDRPGVRSGGREPGGDAELARSSVSSSRSACRVSSPVACSCSSSPSASTSRRRCSAASGTR